MPNTPPALVAGGTIGVSRFVKLSSQADNTGLQCGDNEPPIGISYEGSNYPPLSDLVSTSNAAIAGQEFRLYGDGDVCTIVAGDTVIRGEKLKADSNGRGVPVASTGAVQQFYGATALESAAGAGEKIRVQVNLGSIYPALS